jgi:hypothetical protein
MIIYKKLNPPYTVFIHGKDVMSADDGAIFATLHHAAGGQIHHSQWIESEKDLVFAALCEAQSIITLTCCCCGTSTHGRQWYNRDTGYGLCPKCAKWIATRETPETMQSNYGTPEVHYFTQGE